jgi:hypothetical protein
MPYILNKGIKREFDHYSRMYYFILLAKAACLLLAIEEQHQIYKGMREKVEEKAF